MPLNGDARNGVKSHYRTAKLRTRPGDTGEYSFLSRGAVKLLSSFSKVRHIKNARKLGNADAVIA